MKNMSLSEIAAFIPRIMPEDQSVSVGDEVLIRFYRQKHVLQKVLITHIFESAPGTQIDSILLTRAVAKDRIYLKVEIGGQEGFEYPVWPFQDMLYTYEWVNGYAGKTIIEPPKVPEVVTGASRFARLIKK